MLDCFGFAIVRKTVIRVRAEQGVLHSSTQGLVNHIGGKGFPVRRIDYLRPFVEEQCPTLSNLPYEREIVNLCYRMMTPA
jgi:hypothetical protein